jgi:serine protease Do
MTDLIQQLNDEMADVVDHVKNTLVHVTNNGQSHGAGIIVSSDGSILTNAHVVRQRSLQVTLPDGKTVPARLVAHDTDRDLALLKIDAIELPAMQIGDTQELQAGQWVMAVGHPWGVPGAVTSGVLIDKSNHLISESSQGRQWLAANLHLRPGNSGGPLVDVKGRLLGLNTVMAGPEVGLAVPADVIQTFLQEVAQALGNHEPDYLENNQRPEIV